MNIWQPSRDIWTPGRPRLRRRLPDLSRKFAAGDHIITGGKRAIRSDGKFIISDGTDDCGLPDCGTACSACVAENTPERMILTFTDVTVAEGCFDCFELSSSVNVTGSGFSGTFTATQSARDPCNWEYIAEYDDVKWEATYNSSCDGPFEEASTHIIARVFYLSGTWNVEAALVNHDPLVPHSPDLWAELFYAYDIFMSCEDPTEDIDNSYTSIESSSDCIVPSPGSPGFVLGANIGYYGQVDVTPEECTP